MSRHLGCHTSIRPTQSSSRVAAEDVPLSTPPKKACWQSQSHARIPAAPLSWPLESSASSRFPSRVASPAIMLRGALTTPFPQEPLRRSPCVRRRPTANNVPVMLTPRPLPHLKGGDEHPEGPTLVSDIDCEMLPEIFNSSRQFESAAFERAVVRNIARMRKKSGMVVGRKAPGSHLVPRAYRRTKELSHSVRQRHIGKVTSFTQPPFAMEDENSLSPWNCQRRSPDDDDEIFVSACRRTSGSNHALLEDTHVAVHSAAPVVRLMHTTTAPVACSIERSLSPPEATAVVDCDTDGGDAIGNGVADGEVYHSTFLAISSSDDDAPLLRVVTNEDATDVGKVIMALASPLVSIEASSQRYSREAYLLSVCIELMSRNAHSHTASRYFYTWRRHHEFRRLQRLIPSVLLQTTPTVDCMSPPMTMVRWEPRGVSDITHTIAIDPFASSSTTSGDTEDKETTRVGGEAIRPLQRPNVR